MSVKGYIVHDHIIPPYFKSEIKGIKYVENMEVYWVDTEVDVPIILKTDIAKPVPSTVFVCCEKSHPTDVSYNGFYAFKTLAEARTYAKSYSEKVAIRKLEISDTLERCSKVIRPGINVLNTVSANVKFIKHYAREKPTYKAYTYDYYNNTASYKGYQVFRTEKELRKFNGTDTECTLKVLKINKPFLKSVTNTATCNSPVSELLTEATLLKTLPLVKEPKYVAYTHTFNENDGNYLDYQVFNTVEDLKKFAKNLHVYNDAHAKFHMIKLPKPIHECVEIVGGEWFLSVPAKFVKEITL